MSFQIVILGIWGGVVQLSRIGIVYMRLVDIRFAWTSCTCCLSRKLGYVRASHPKIWAEINGLGIKLAHLSSAGVCWANSRLLLFEDNELEPDSITKTYTGSLTISSLGRFFHSVGMRSLGRVLKLQKIRECNDKNLKNFCGKMQTYKQKKQLASKRRNRKTN